MHITAREGRMVSWSPWFAYRAYERRMAAWCPQYERNFHERAHNLWISQMVEQHSKDWTKQRSYMGGK